MQSRQSTSELVVQIIGRLGEKGLTGKEKTGQAHRPSTGMGGMQMRNSLKFYE